MLFLLRRWGGEGSEGEGRGGFYEVCGRGVKRDLQRALKMDLRGIPEGSTGCMSPWQTASSEHNFDRFF